MTNPLLDWEQFPNYELIRPEHLVPAIEATLKEARAKITALINQAAPYTFNNTFLADLHINEMIEKVNMPISQFYIMNATPEFMEEYQKAQKLQTEYYNQIMMDENYFIIFKTFYDSPEAKKESGERRRHMDNVMRGFKMSGVGLPEAQKNRLKEINIEMSELSVNFQKNATSSTFELILDQTELDGLTADVLESAKQKATNLGQADKWAFNLDFPSYLPFMKYSTRRDLRQKLWEKFLTRGANEKYDNRPIIQKLLTLRNEKSLLLGFKSYGEYSLETKMASSPDEVLLFLNDISQKLDTVARGEMDELRAFAKQNGQNEDLAPWDIAFWSTKLKEEKYAFNENELREYFELETSIDGLFKIAKELFGLSFKRKTDIPFWHQDVRAYEVYDQKETLRGYIYMDLFPRSGLKRGGAWAIGMFKSKNDPAGKVLPQVTMCCNFTQPTGDKPALLTYGELNTLFHEFGHALHDALSQTELSATAGTNTCWDAVELPSSFMENFIKSKETLTLFAKHYQTKAVIPDALIQKVLSSLNFQEAMGTKTQMAYSIADMEMHHTEPLKGSIPDAHQVFARSMRKHAVTPYLETSFYEASFVHVFAGGYPAGYYSYIWANILDADAFAAFEESGKILNREIGAKFMEHILEKGDSEDMNILFEKFRGRKVKVDALLKRLGVK